MNTGYLIGNGEVRIFIFRDKKRHLRKFVRTRDEIQISGVNPAFRTGHPGGWSLKRPRRRLPSGGVTAGREELGLPSGLPGTGASSLSPSDQAPFAMPRRRLVPCRQCLIFGIICLNIGQPNPETFDINP